MLRSLSTHLGALITGTSLWCAAAFAQDRISWPRGLSTRAEAIALLQDSLSSRLFIDSVSVAEIEHALLVTRAGVPEVAPIRIAPVWPRLTVYLEREHALQMRRDHATSSISERPGVLPEWRLRRTGHSAADSLLALHGVVAIHLVDWSGVDRSDQDFKIEIEFAHAMNLAAARRLYEAVGFGMPSAPRFVDLTWTDGFLSKSDTVWTFHFVAGLGDCPAGCSGYDHYFVAFDPLARSAKIVKKWRGGWRVPDSPPNKPLLQTPEPPSVL